MKEDKEQRAKYEYNAPVYNIHIGYVEKQINGNYYETHYADGHTEENNAAPAPSDKKAVGPPKYFLFVKDGNPTLEDINVRKTEAERFKKYIRKHKMGNELLTTRKDKLNEIISCFWHQWHRRNLVGDKPSGNAIYRFLTEDCEVKASVQEKSFGNKINTIIENKDIDIITSANVEACFLKK